MSGRSKVFVGVCRCLMACDVSRGLMCSAHGMRMCGPWNQTGLHAGGSPDWVRNTRASPGATYAPGSTGARNRMWFGTVGPIEIYPRMRMAGI